MSAGMIEPTADLSSPELVSRAAGLLASMNQAGVLAAVDVHIARTLGRLGGETDPEVLLAVALASRAPRLGHLRVELATVHATVTTEEPDAGDLDALAWPAPDGWLRAVRASPLVADGDAPSARPLRLHDDALYLDRYWRHERLVAAALRARAGRFEPGADATAEPGAADDGQASALAVAARRPLTVIAGGPGTGKTTTVARLLAVLGEEAAAAGRPFPRVALAAPTGKAANRLQASIAAASEELGTAGPVREWLLGLDAATIHRLLGSLGTGTRFRHDQANPLPHDVVIVDEASMVAVSLMARLLEAVGPVARLVIVGDPDQLASVEAGAVLGDVVAGARVPAETPAPAAASDAAPRTPGLRESIVHLRTVHRFAEGSGIAALASAVRSGDADGALEVLTSGYPDLAWLDLPEATRSEHALAGVKAALETVGAERNRAAQAGDVRAALGSLDRLQVLAAHRRGPEGSRAWGARIGAWLGEADPWDDRPGARLVGTPLMVTANDYGIGLFNGDIGVVVADGEDDIGPFDRPDRRVAFGPIEAPRLVAESRLGDVEPVHALTIHKSQGSEFDHVVVVLPDAGSRLLTRELFYTGVTRARERLTLLASQAALRQAIGRRIRRASGLRDALWGPVYEP